MHDLRLLVEDLSDAAELPADAMGEQVFTVEELARQFNVSTKTISRWRELGLVSRRLVFDGRKRVGFLRSSVDRFVRNNAERVERGARFSQLSDEQRAEFIEHARELAANGGGQAEIARRLAERTGRSVETIRAALAQHDLDNPETAIFPVLGGPLTDVQKHNVYEAYRRGASVDKLCSDYNRTKTTIYRVINEVRAERIMELPLDYIDNPRFRRKGADNAILGPMPESRRADPQAAASVGPAAVPGEPVRDAAAHPRAGAAPVPQVQLPQVQGRRSCARSSTSSSPRRQLMDEIEELYEEIVATKNQIARRTCGWSCRSPSGTSRRTRTSSSS